MGIDPRRPGSAEASDAGDLRRPLAGGVTALVVAMGIGRFAFTPILPAMREAFGLSPTTLGALASANYLGYLVGAILAAALGRRSHHAALRASLVVVVAATGLMGATTAVPAWLALRFLAGLASAGVFVVGSAAVLGLLARRGRPELAGWFYGGVGLGIALSGLVVLAVGGALGGGPEAWRAEWLGVASLAAALVAPCWAWLPPADGGQVDPAADRPVAPRGRVPPALVLLGAAYFLEGAGYIVTGTFLVAIVATLPGLAGLGAGAWILVGLAGAPSAVFWARAAARVGPVPALVVAYAAQAVGVALPALSGGGWAAAASAFLFGGTFIGITALTVGYARGHVPPEGAARTIGLLTAAFGLGQVLGPLVAARLAGGRADFGPALLVAACAVLAGGLLTVAAGLTLAPARRLPRR